MRPLIIVVLMLYALGGAVYFSYHAFKITRAFEGINDQVWFFFAVLNNPLWRWLYRRPLTWQTPELKAHILRIEIQKYLFIVLGILMGGSAFILARLRVL